MLFYLYKNLRGKVLFCLNYTISFSHCSLSSRQLVGLFCSKTHETPFSKSVFLNILWCTIRRRPGENTIERSNENAALSVHCKWRPIWFPFMYSQKWNCAASLFQKQNYNVMSPNSFIHICICERFIYFQGRSVYFAATKYVDWSWEYINRSQTHECRVWYWGWTIPFLGIHKLYFRYSVWWK